MTPALVQITERQEEALWLVSQGFSTTEMGVRLGISTRGARYLVDELRRRFGVKYKRDLTPFGKAMDVWTVQAIKDRLNGTGGD